MSNKDVFISYRRQDGATTARLLCDILEKRGVTVFFDRESIGSGHFDDAIQSNLESSRNVLVVVSPEMFSRGRNADGSYDPQAVAVDWVYRELQLSLEAKKNIIPVFVNGANGFPAVLPKEIAEIARLDALTLNHENFQENLRKLISRLITPKHDFLEQYSRVLDGEDDQLEIITENCVNFSESSERAIKDFLLNQIRKNWTESKASEDALEILLGRLTVSTVKKICKKLEIEHRGGMRRIKTSLTAFLDGQPVPAILDQDDSESQIDRVDKLAAAFGRVFRSVDERQRAQDILDPLEIDFYELRSSQVIFKQVFEERDVEELFKKTNFSENDIKDVCVELFPDLGDSIGRKSVLIARICDYVNYVE